MRQVRVPLAEVRPGEHIVKIGNREVGSRFERTEDVAVGQRVSGPRGGAYRLTAEGARRYVVVVTYAGRPIVERTATATVLRDEEE